MEEIDVALASDHNYFCGLLVTAVSMARHASRNVRLRLNVLDGGLTDEDWAILRQKVGSEHPQAELRRFCVNDARFLAFPEWNGMSRMTYARLLLPEMLVDAEHVVYCDVDFLWQTDLAELWALRDRDCEIQGCTDQSPILKARESKWFGEHGLEVDIGRYICAGMMIMNLQKFRDRGLAQKAMKFLQDHLDVNYVDQTALNAVVKDIRLLPRKWHRFSYEVRRSELKDPIVIHFAGDAPWKAAWWTQPISPCWFVWHRFYGGLCGLSAWQSLRKIYSRGAIFKRCFVCGLIRTPIVRELFFVFLRIFRRGEYIPFLKEKSCA